MTTNDSSTNVTMPRYPIVDIARGTALLAMTSYHFVFDLEILGQIEQGTANSYPFKPYARAIAASFLCLVGVSMVLGYHNTTPWTSILKKRRWQRRIISVLLCALLITLATFWATPDAFIHFGILHHIALASLIGLPFLRLPIVLLIFLALFSIYLPYYFQLQWLVGYHGWWTGLASSTPRSSDFVPIFPWFGVVIAGIALGKILIRFRLLDKTSNWRLPGRTSKALIFIGQHSLIFYMIHQPILIGGLVLYLKLRGQI